MSEHEADLLAQNRSAPSGLPGTALAVARAPKATAPLEESSCEPDAVCNALDEFLTRCRAGEDLDPDSFCDEHPSIKSSLRKVLTVQRVFEANDDLLASPEEDKWPHAGQVFLGLELRRFLGQGAFARVFLATEEALGGRRVAVKL